MASIRHFNFPALTDERFPEFMAESYKRAFFGHLAYAEILEWLIENAEPTKSELDNALKELEAVKDAVSFMEYKYMDVLQLSKRPIVSIHFFSDEIEQRKAKPNDLFFGNKEFPVLLIDKILEACIGHNSMADLCEWMLTRCDPTDKEQDDILEYLHDYNNAAAYFEYKHEELRKIFNLPENIPILHDILLRIRKTEPSNTNIQLLDKYVESLKKESKANDVFCIL